MDPLITLIAIPLLFAFLVFVKAVYLRPAELKPAVMTRSSKTHPCKTMVVLGSGNICEFALVDSGCSFLFDQEDILWR
jgi:hypothetical protein